MAESRDDPELLWIDPQERGIIPLEGFHLPRRLKRTVRQDKFRVSVDQDFGAVIRACALPRPGHPESWINAQIISLYEALARAGQAHSVECRDPETNELVGGLYGVKLGAAFFGESMFSTATDASKVALVHLVARLRAGNFSLLDAQFENQHLTQFGARVIPRAAYQERLAAAISGQGDFMALPAETDGASVLRFFG
ncbi:aat [Symbiodinium microadriaticum]|nr:aat [Symbiodinium microadriaticum]